MTPLPARRWMGCSPLALLAGVRHGAGAGAEEPASETRDR
jgi:hypothetical protein